MYHKTSDISGQSLPLIFIKTLDINHSILDGWKHPRILSLGGDHSIVLPILRSLKTVYGPISVIHLDSHLDT